MDILLSNIPVLCLTSPDGTAGAKETFDKLEAKLPNLKKRKFYGVVGGIPPQDTYRACVTVMEGDDPKTLGLETWIIPGGKYARTKIKDWEKNLDQIGPTFASLIKQHIHDPTRPSIEFYRSMSEMFCFVPIK